MNIQNIKSLADNSKVRILAVAATIKEGITGTGSPFLDLRISDKSSEIFGKIWNSTEGHATFFASPVAVWLEGKLGTYKDQRQLIVDFFEEAGDDIDLSSYIPSAPLEAKTMYIDILNRADSFADQTLKDTTIGCLTRVGLDLLSAPAAKTHHHNYYGGLLYHITGLLHMSDSICAFRPQIYKDLLDASIILHDLAKVAEMEHKYGIVSDYSFEGKLFGHIVMIDRWITEFRVKNNLMDNQTLDLLQHILLSHHNLAEWGSPTQPQCLEAVVLHYLDQLDAKSQMAIDAVDKTSGLWSDKVYALENKQLLNHELGGNTEQVSSMQSFKKEE